MAISLVCACGVHFEVEDTFAGQGVSCPECHRHVKAPAQGGGPLRTSGYAVASLVLALVLAFTVVGTALAVVVGIMALVSIARHPDRVTGAGYAVGGIVLGLVFTGLTLFAFDKRELFDEARQKVLGGQVDRSGPLEIIREKEGFAITRPTDRWGVAGAELAQNLKSTSTLMLADIGKDAYIDVAIQQVGPMSLAQCRENVLTSFQESDNEDVFGKPNRASPSGYKLLSSKHLPPLGDAAVEELLLDVRVLGQPFRFLVHLIKEDRTGKLFVLRGWAFRRRFELVESEVRKGIESFRLLHPQGAAGAGAGVP